METTKPRGNCMRAVAESIGGGENVRNESTKGGDNGR